MEMYDLNGRVIRQTRLTQTQTEINVSDLEKGMFLLKVNMDGKVSWERVAIQ